MEASFKQIEQMWRRQDERLQNIERVQRETVSCLLQRNLASTHRRFVTETTTAVVVCGITELYVLMQAGYFFGSWRMAVPYIIFNLVYSGIGVWTTVWMMRLRRHDPLTTPTVEMMRFADRWQLCLKRSMLWGLSIVIPVCVAAGMPVFARLFGHSFHYSDLQYLAPWRIVAVLGVYIVCIVYTVYEMRLTRELKDNLRHYDELLR